jgi:hypothetical protein
MLKPFIPKDFLVPIVLETDQLRLRMLTVNDVIKDYDAVMSSIDHLQHTKPFWPNHNWPTKELTLEQDLIDLWWHQKEFQKRSSFAYTVMSLDEKECLGCVYMYPSANSLYDVEIMLWVRESRASSNLDNHLFGTVKYWIEKSWPFKNPGFPGRDIAWDKWEELQ